MLDQIKPTSVDRGGRTGRATDIEPIERARAMTPRSAGTILSHLNGPVFLRAAIVAAFLGSVLTLLNQSGAIFASEQIQRLPFVLVYATPFTVVVISQVLGARQASHLLMSRRGDAGEGKSLPPTEAIISRKSGYGQAI